MLPILAVAGLYLVTWGYSPGGGFPGGAVILGVLLLVYASYGRRKISKVIRPGLIEPLELAGAGLIIMTEFLGLVFQGSFSANWLPLAPMLTPLSGGVDNHMPAGIEREFLEAGFDPALDVARLAFDNGPIDFFHSTSGEQPAQPAQRLGMPAEDEAATGVAVEAMSERRRMGQTEAQLIKGAFEIWTAAGSAVHGNPRRLVDDQYEPVTIEHPSGQ